MPREGARPRCADVLSALADEGKRNQLCLAPFDMVSLDGKSYEGVPYQETYNALSGIFKADAVCPVQMMHASSLDEVQAIYDEWVECEGAEGLVIHSDSNIVAKVKPRHSIDAAIVGYTTGEQGVRDLMLAARREDGLFQVFAVGSGALSDADRASLADRLQSMDVE
jgi:ATP-dependent DNA ligase